MYDSDTENENEVGVKLTYLVDQDTIYVALDARVLRSTPPCRPIVIAQTPPESPVAVPARRRILKKHLDRSRALAEFERRKKHRPCMMSAEPRPSFL